MRITAENLRAFVSALPDYERLPDTARRALTAIERPAQGCSSSALGGSTEALIEAGFLLPHNNPGRCFVTPSRQDFIRVLRAIRSYSVLRTPKEPQFSEYISDLLTAVEREAFQSGPSRYFERNHALFRQVTAPDWLEDFLSAKGKDWEKPYITLGTRALFSNPEVLRATQSLAGWLLERQSPVGMHDIPALQQNAELSSQALHAALRYALLFIELDPGTLNVTLGVWPSIAAHRALASQLPPKNVVPSQSWDAPFLMEDMTALLIACATEPLRLKANDGELYAKAIKDLSHALLPLPEWAEHAFAMDPEIRIITATAFVRAFELVEERIASQSAQMAIGERGRRWLNLDRGNRLKALLDGAIGSKPEMGGSQEFEDAQMGLLASPVYVTTTMKSPPNLKTESMRPFRELPNDEFFPIEEIATFSLKDNPLLAILRRDKHAYFSFNSRYLDSPTAEQLQQLWRDVIILLVPSLLFPLGCVRLGLGKDGLSIAMTPAGRYLLGQTKRWEWTETTDSQVIVQPNFEVTFLGEAPAVEAEIGRFAERRGRQMGALFQITKKSIFAASAADMTAESVLETLERVCSREVPGNVRREIQGWFAQCRKVSVESATLIRCPDRETALRIVSLSKGSAVALSDTILEYKENGKPKPWLMNKLKEMGVLVSVSVQEKVKREPVRREKTQWARW